MSESNLWRTTRLCLSPYGKLYRIEDLLGSGTPDVHYCLLDGRAIGWIELKYSNKWKLSETIIIPSLTLDQVVWHINYPGRVYTLAQIGSAYLLINSEALSDIYERKMTPARLIEQSLVYSPRGFPTRPLLKALL